MQAPLIPTLRVGMQTGPCGGTRPPGEQRDDAIAASNHAQARYGFPRGAWEPGWSAVRGNQAGRMQAPLVPTLRVGMQTGPCGGTRPPGGQQDNAIAASNHVQARYGFPRGAWEPEGWGLPRRAWEPGGMPHGAGEPEHQGDQNKNIDRPAS
ncbi:MAG: hypothetical protein CTY22_01610 [Methylomonas sp.]|nr:MAG: hypothetical protein CTY22_01610 [Methylomonas sp.]PPD39579.1 MAG: hypothetical protein CTY21_01605 [Methylomonas sp.]PPD55830.1 MAG: hypothetical protein CTY11_00875 [Methylomonas sp.]